MKVILLLSSLSLVVGGNDDLFNYAATSGNDYGPEDWNKVTCDDLEMCTGWPDKWLQGVGWKLEVNSCKWCPKGSDQCGRHHQSPIDLERNRAIAGDPMENECIDIHWMKYEDSSCTWDQMVDAGAFTIERHALKMSQPLEYDQGGDNSIRLACPAEEGRKYGRIDFSKGFSEWWFLSHINFKVPSEHTQEGKRYSGEVQMAHFYSVSGQEAGVDNEMAHVSIFLEAYDDSPPYPFLDRLICQWRKVEDRVREQCNLPSVGTYPGCFNPTRGFTPAPSVATPAPSAKPVREPGSPTSAPSVTSAPTSTPSSAPTISRSPSRSPTPQPTPRPTVPPFTRWPSVSPSVPSTPAPTFEPSSYPTIFVSQTEAPVISQTEAPVTQPPVGTAAPISITTEAPVQGPSSSILSDSPSASPTSTVQPPTPNIAVARTDGSSSPAPSDTPPRVSNRGRHLRKTVFDIIHENARSDMRNTTKLNRVALDPVNFREADWTDQEWAAWAEAYSSHQTGEVSGQRNLLEGDHLSFHNYQFLIDCKTEYYFRYSGTSTVPPCYGPFTSESRGNTSHWRVMKDPVRVHPRQIAEMERLLRERINPDSCEKDTAAKVDSDGHVSVARPLMQTNNVHFITFCECQDWPSKWPEDRAWCDLGNQNFRLYDHPYNFNTAGIF